MKPALSKATLSGLRGPWRRPSSASTLSRFSALHPSNPLLRNLSASCPRRESGRKWSTPLAKQLTDAINITGPIPLASYMRMCLTSDVGGYYTGAIDEGRDQFGRKGDFITSPEISQIFGELVGIWFVAEWLSQGQPREAVELIEVGPGRGTLMDDMLRTISNFKDMVGSIGTIYLVEASKELREQQKALLCGEEKPMIKTDEGWSCTSKYSDIPIVWTETIRGLPPGGDKVPFIVAHEFFDALPIHAFETVEVPPAPTATTPDGKTKAAPSGRAAADAGPTIQWREMVVSPTPEGTTHAELGTHKLLQNDPVPEFQMTLSPDPTRHSKYLPESSPRFRALKSKPGNLIEVCPDASLYATEFASRIGGKTPQPGMPLSPRQKTPRGAALILDYGPSETIPTNSLRGIRQHRRVGPFQEPGLVDLSADVDFVGVADAALGASPGVEIHGPVDQAFFLEQMGIRQRAEMLTNRLRDQMRTRVEAGEGDVTPLLKKVAELEKSWRRLVDIGPEGMGKLYKVMAMVPENDGKRKPTGFGGDIS